MQQRIRSLEISKRGWAQFKGKALGRYDSCIKSEEICSRSIKHNNNKKNRFHFQITVILPVSKMRMNGCLKKGNSDFQLRFWEGIHKEGL